MKNGMYVNSDDEYVEVSHGTDGAGHYELHKTWQRNGWVRINWYYDDGSICETYKKEPLEP